MILTGTPRELNLSELPGLDARAVAFLAGPGGGKTTGLREFFNVRGMGVLGIDPAGELARRLEADPHVDVLHVPKNHEGARIGPARTPLADWVVGRLRDGGRVCVDLSRCYKDVAGITEGIVSAAWDGRVRRVLYVFEEAQRYMGQGTGKESDACYAVYEMGRNLECGRIAATQRPAELNKRVLARCDTWFLGRVSHPRDVDAYDEALELSIPARAERQAVLREMMNLQAGHFLLRTLGHLPTVNR